MAPQVRPTVPGRVRGTPPTFGRRGAAGAEDRVPEGEWAGVWMCGRDKAGGSRTKPSKTSHSEIRQSYQALRAAKIAAMISRQYIENQPAPRYDDVFQSVESLERLAGNDFSPGKLTCAFSDDFWKSKARHGPSLP